MNSNVAQHFRPSEVPFLKSCDNLVNRTLSEYRPVLTNFLNPRQVYLLKVISNGYSGSHFEFSGGLKNAEMKRALLYPDYFKPMASDFKLALVEIKYPSKFVQIRHSQILGTLMGSGIKRNVVGDIFTNGTRWQFVTERHLLPFLKAEVTRIGRNKVKLFRQPFSRLINPVNDAVQRFLTVTSLRIDGVIAKGFGISRGSAKSIIKHGRVRLNWGEFDAPDYEMQPDDVLSVRHHGRLRLKSLNGKSKKGKLKIMISLIKK